ncbi:MAG: ACP S-malonyltransferase [Gammaproteobacteria bacterium]|nr:MAG: ACP S-malonyltransferase [Gammaproteobacteria bacterium]TLZ01461.1 MAG: ACP S-malonyltransferase [Gammaproteobacteria bacterium]TLZ39359.1 MAG: ACP S-malonyltransferase [Gammaproteobacteria bacterium]
MSFAFVFPGQGSQSVGMLGALATAESAVRATFDEASRALGFDLWKLVSEGPEEALNATERTQPAMLAAGVAVWRVWRARGGALPEVVCGHSLGEFTALVCAEGLPFGATVELVRFRGQVMQEAVPAGSGAMAAIIGLDDEAIEAACREAAQGAVVEAANFNGAGQVVIAGEKAAVQRAIEAARARGARRAVALPVSVPSHTSLMRGAAERLRERLHSLEVRAPRIRYVSAVDASAHERPDEIRELLVRQLSSPVRWTDTLRAVSAGAVAQVIECGPGKVLTGLNRRIERRADLDFLALEDPSSIEAALAATRGGSHA